MLSISNPETWRIYNPHYEVSSQGRVKSTRNNKVLTTFVAGAKTKKEYVDLWWGGVRHRKQVAHLVAEVFLGPRPDGLVVCHGSLGPLNNSTTNLKYASQSQNIKEIWEDGKSRGNSKYLGVHLCGSRWRARLYGEHLGRFNTEHEAAQAVNAYIIANNLGRRLNPV